MTDWEPPAALTVPSPGSSGGGQPVPGVADPLAPRERAQGRRIDDEVLTHISPAHSENVNFFGSIAVDVERELAKLDPSGYRPLRERSTVPAGLLL